MGDLPQEETVGIYLNNKNQIVGTSVVARGTQSMAVVGTPDLLRMAILSGATRFMMAHNHPSGDPTPSKQDVALTKRVRDAGDVVGIALLDHIVVGNGKYVSLRDRGLM